jgi:hypothetical protein
VSGAAAPAAASSSKRSQQERPSPTKLTKSRDNPKRPKRNRKQAVPFHDEIPASAKIPVSRKDMKHARRQRGEDSSSSSNSELE